MSEVRNVLFIMCDQLRADFLSCYGNSALQTPNIDAIAARGVRFTRAYVQSGVCGPSRMSYYTGRYPSSHGATWNFIPMPMSELTLGDYLEASGRKLHLIGKTHFEPASEAFAAAASGGLRNADSLLEGGFSVVVRHEGDLPRGKRHYSEYLNSMGYGGDDPWHEFANSGRDADGNFADGWLMRNAAVAASVVEEHSETAYVTTKAIEFMRAMQDEPWVLHLSYIKPHWPYIAPAPYNAMFRTADALPIRRSSEELVDEHPVIKAYRTHDECVAFGREDVARHVRPTYMGLVKQIDDHIGRVLEELDQLGQLESTLIIFASDHGDFLGDHGLGEKELFYEQAQNVPFIISDPSAAANATRGSVDARFVECIDVVPTILDVLGLDNPAHRVEGRSLVPLIREQSVSGWRDYVVSELDYSTRRARHVLQRPVDAVCRGYMVREERWKFVHWPGFRPQLFDLHEDPDEYRDLGADPAFDTHRERLQGLLLDWSLKLKRRTAVDNERIETMTDNLPPGIHIGQW